ncbi:MAG: hypothetical protein HY974_02725 [Candidatus Kerfeldbacteria bacterium]|nr:hypothetical protein [Candidatus Kerfeldbacteria bacterium]
MEQLQPKHHHFILGCASVVSALVILAVGAPYIFAQTDTTQQIIPDTSLTVPQPIPTPSTTPLPTGTPDSTFNPNLPPQPIPQLATPAEGATPPLEQKISAQNVKPAPQLFLDEGEVQPPQDFIDPREVMNALRDMTMMRNELKRFSKQLAKSPGSTGDVTQVQSLLKNLDEFSQAIKAAQKGNDNENLREALQEFWQAQLWDEINKIRAKVELPKELKTIEKELKRAQKLSTQASFQKLGFNLENLKTNLEVMRQAYNEVTTKLQANEYEEAMEAMQQFHDNGHPGEITGVIYRLRDLQRFLKKIKDGDVRAQITEILQPVLESFNQGEFRDARELMDDAFPQLMQLGQVALRIQQSRTGNKGLMMEQFGELEEKIRAKLEGLDNDEKGMGSRPQVLTPQSTTQP